MRGKHCGVSGLHDRGAGRDLFDAAQRLDLGAIVAKRKVDPYAAGVTWHKIKNRAYTQMEGRGELFHGPR